MRPAIAITAVVVVLAVVAGIFALVGGDGDDGTTTTITVAGAGVGDEGPAALGGDTATLPDVTATTRQRTTSTTEPTETTSAAPGRTTITAPPRTTAPGVQPNQPPVVTIGPPNPLQRFEAFFDPASGRFIASVPLVANVTDPEGDAFTVDWFSSLDGYLGSGQSITAGLSPDLDTSQPVITARATDVTGAVGEFSLQIIVWIRSDE